MSQIRSIIQENRGQAIVEFALILPVLILLLAGILDFGLILNQYITVSHAAREGARSAALGGTDATAIADIKAAASGLDTTQLVISISPATRIRGNSVTVSVSSPIQPVTPLIGSFFTTKLTVNSSVVMRVE